MKKFLVIAVGLISLVGETARAKDPQEIYAKLKKYEAELQVSSGLEFFSLAAWMGRKSAKKLRPYMSPERPMVIRNLARAGVATSLIPYYGSIYATGDGLHGLDQKYNEGAIGNFLTGRIHADVSVTEAKQKVMPAEAMQMGDVPGSPYAVTWGAN